MTVAAAAMHAPSAASPAPAIPAAAHLVHAQAWRSDRGSWEPPPTLASADDAVLAAAVPWQTVGLPHARDRSTVADKAMAHAGPDVQWYRLQVPPDALRSTPQGPRLYIPRWQTVGTVAVYANGQLVWQSRGSRVWNSFNEPVWVDLGGHAAPGAPLTLHVRMASLPGVGGALSTVWAGPAEALRTAWRLRSLLQTDLLAYLRGAYLILGVLALVLWFTRSQRRETGYLLFFLLSVSHLLATLFYLVDREGYAVHDEWFSWISLMGSLGASVFSFLLLCRMQGARHPRLGGTLAGYATALAVVSLPLWGLAHETLLPVLRMALVPPALLVLCVAVLGAWRERSVPNTLLALAVALSFPLAAHDLALQRYAVDIEHPYLTTYGYMGVFSMFLLVAFNRYVRALGAAEQANAVLAERLAVQEQELNASHERLRAVERAQTLLQERQRLMREMHDGVGSSLISALRLVEGAPAAPVDVAQVLRECIDDLKISIDSLDTVDADLLALLAGLRYRLGPRLEGAGLALQWQVTDLPALPWLDTHSALHILRILQEVLTNIVKHAHATEITITTQEAPAPATGSAVRGPGVQVCIHDNGQGFTPAPAAAQPPGRRGLANVRSRAVVLQAHCAWEAAAAGGTTFTLWLPLSAPP